MISNWNSGESFQGHSDRVEKFSGSHNINQKIGTRGGDPFEEHVGHMRMFRSSHTPDLKVSRRDVINMICPLPAAGAEIETGGSTGATRTTDWSSTIPVWKVASHKFSQN